MIQAWYLRPLIKSVASVSWRLERCGIHLASSLNCLDPEDDTQLSDALQERVENGALFYWEAGDTLDF